MGSCLILSKLENPALLFEELIGGKLFPLLPLKLECHGELWEGKLDKDALRASDRVRDVPLFLQ